MAKKKRKTMCSCCNWSGKDWLWAIVGEASLYLFFVYAQYLLKVQANYWLSAVLLLVLINVMWFACPCTRDLCKN